MLEYSHVHVAQADLTTAARYMFWLMFRNVASDGMVFDDPVNAGIISSPGCVLASPSWENTATHVTQDYVYHWTRDAAIVALELSATYASGVLPDNQPLNDYVRFSETCQQSPGDFGRASFYIDVAASAIYGAESVTDPRLLATAAQLRAQWADPGSPYFYPVNSADAARGIGPMLGRYPGDVYDGDTDALTGDHPWALTTANFAELYYRLAAKILSSAAVPADSLSAAFLTQVGVDAATPWVNASAALRAAGDSMLSAIVFHSDHFELSEQFDATTGFEKSVSNLSWSYAAFLSAVRARSSTG